MEAEDLLAVQVGHLGCVDVGGAREGVDLLGEVVHAHHDRVEPVGLGQLGDQIHPHLLPGALLS